MMGSDERLEMLAAVRHKAAQYAKTFDGTPWKPDQLSDVGWLILVGVPWLLDQVEREGKQDGKGGDADRDPGAQFEVSHLGESVNVSVRLHAGWRLGLRLSAGGEGVKAEGGQR